jgi:hypothetical protein
MLRQGQVAVNSILRDWIKGQVTAVECGILSFEAMSCSARPGFEIMPHKFGRQAHRATILVDELDMALDRRARALAPHAGVWQPTRAAPYAAC